MTKKSLRKLQHQLMKFSTSSAILENSSQYLRIVEDILSYQKPKALFFIFLTFKKDKTLYDIFDRVKLLIEKYFVENYVSLILGHLEVLITMSPEWTCNLLYDIVTTPNQVKTLQKLLQRLNPSCVNGIINSIEGTSYTLKEFTDELRHRLHSTIYEVSHHA